MIKYGAYDPLYPNGIISVAGDPRISERSISYREWWSLLGPHRVELMRSWLSRFDMELFLRIISEFAQQDGDMARMFPRRKKLLEHIFEKNRVTMTRLFLGSQAGDFVKRWSRNESPRFTPIRDNPRLTVFYYRIVMFM